MLDTIEWKNRTITADELGPELAMPTESNGAFHIAFEGNKKILIRQTGGRQFDGGKAHHDLWAAAKDHGFLGIEARPVKQHRHNAHTAGPALVGPIHSNHDFDIFIWQ